MRFIARNSKFLVPAVCLLLLLSPSPTPAQTPTYTDQDGHPFPLSNMYEFCFSYQLEMEKLAMEREKNGLSGAPMRDILRLRFQLTPAQFATFWKVALRFQARADEIDQRMHTIVAADRATHPKTRRLSPEARSQVQPLYAERDTAASDAVLQLHQQLDPATASALDRAVIMFFVEAQGVPNAPPSVGPTPQPKP